MKKAVMISCFDWYASRLRPVRDILLRKGYQVSVYIADFSHIKKTPIEDKHGECSYIPVPHYKSNLSLARVISHLSFERKAEKAVGEIGPDLLFVQMPPNHLGQFCMKYRRKNSGTKLIFDLMDLWPESMPIGFLKKTVFLRAWMKWRDRGLSAADYVFTECDLYRQMLKSRLDPEKSGVLYLYKDQDAALAERVKRAMSEKSAEGDTLRLAYLGSMNHILDIEGICGVMSRLIEDGYKVELHAVGDGEKRAEFQNAAGKTGCAAFFYGVVFDEEEKIRILANCHFAFNMMKSTSEVGLTTKSIDYFSMGLPLINNIRGDTWKIVESEGCGINVDEGSSLDAAALLSESREMSLRARGVFEKFFDRNSFEKQVEAVLTRLEI